MGWFQKTFGMQNIGWTPSSGWRSIKDWFSGQKSADISSAAQIETSYALNQQQMALDLWRAKNLPAAQKEGYRAAGLNPILMGNQSPVVASSHQSNVSADPQSLANVLGGVGSLISSARDMATFRSDVDAAKSDAAATKAEAAKLANEVIRSENDANKSAYDSMARGYQAVVEEVDNAARIEAMTGVRETVANEYDGKEYRRLVEMYRNQIDRGAYESSKGHAIYEDVLNTGKTAAEVMSRVRLGKDKGKSSRRGR